VLLSRTDKHIAMALIKAIVMRPFFIVFRHL
jgi:hypothetical protein